MIHFFKSHNRDIAFKFLNQERFNDHDPLLVFLHEGLGSIQQWKHFPQRLCERLGLAGLVYDRYGYGQSTALQEPRTLDYHRIEAEQSLPALLNFLKIHQKVILFGHSDGGTIALWYAALFPERALALVSEAAHVFIEPMTFKGIEVAVKSYEAGPLKKLLARFHGDHVDSTFYGWADPWLLSEFRSWNIEEILPQICCPVLVIQGADDEYGSHLQVESIAQKVSGQSESLIIPHCRHHPHLEKQDLVLQKTVDFLRSYLSHSSTQF